MSYFRENYSHLLEGKFINTKSKGYLEVSYDLGIETQSLTTFYKHYQSKEKYIQGLISGIEYNRLFVLLK